MKVLSFSIFFPLSYEPLSNNYSHYGEEYCYIGLNIFLYIYIYII